MASDRNYLEYVLEQLSALEDVSYRAMMGEYIIYYQGKVVGGIYDDRFLVKDTASSRKLMPEAEYQLPYEGAKKMLAADVDDRSLLIELIPAIAADLPDTNKRNKRKKA